MSKDFVIFKNPKLRYRSEEFGGILRLRFKILIINQKQYRLIDKMKKFVVYSELDEIDKKIADKLIEEKALLKVDLEKAKKIGFKG